MSGISDIAMRTLRSIGYSGALNDMLQKYYNRAGTTYNSINDAEREFLLHRYPSGAGSNQDFWMGYLRSLEYTGAIHDMLRGFWTTSNPISLFSTGEEGVWYDPSDFSTMFQDSAGTTPVTAVEQPVGMLLDKSRGLVLGSETITNGTFNSDTTGWTALNGATLSVVSGKLRVTSNSTYGAASQMINTTANQFYKLSIDIASGGFNCSVQAAGGTVLAAAVRNGSYTVYFMATAATSTINVISNVSTGNYVDFDNISVKALPGNHSFQATSTKRPVLKQDANGKYYLLFDGVDDGMATARIDFSATDKVTVFAGVRKLSDAAQGMICEISVSGSTNAGSFLLLASSSSLDRYQWTSRGTAGANAVPAGYAAPITNILTGVGDISGDIARIRINGATIVTTTADQGTGNYGNHPLYIGARADTSLYFNGHLYGLIVRGAQSSAAEIAAAEAYMNLKTGAY